MSMFVGAIFTIMLGSKINPKKIALFFSFLNLLMWFGSKTYLDKKIALGGWSSEGGIVMSSDPIGSILVFLISLLGFLGILYASGNTAEKGKEHILFFSLTMFYISNPKIFLISGACCPLISIFYLKI